MKSIKEKAEEYSRYIANSEYTKEDFVSGANYVLDVLYNIANREDWILDPNNGVRRFFEIYKQLKK